MGLFEAIFGKSAPKDDTAQKQAFYLSDDRSEERRVGKECLL